MAGGPVAEALHTPGGNIRWFSAESWLSAGRDDNADAEATAINAGVDDKRERDALLLGIVSDVFDFLLQPAVWRVVKQLAVRLDAEGEISGDEIKAAWTCQPNTNGATEKLIASLEGRADLARLADRRISGPETSARGRRPKTR
jgi:hypothetical protein